MFEGGSEKKVPRREIFTGGGPVNSLAMVVVVKHRAENGAKILFTLGYSNPASPPIP